MNDNTKKILDMLSENKITTDEAYKLLEAIKSKGSSSGMTDNPFSSPKKIPKYLRVTVMPKDSTDSDDIDRVNIRVPLSLIKTGIKLTALIPPQAFDRIDDALKDKGIQFDIRNIKKEDLDDLIEALVDMEVDVQSSRGEKVRVFVE